MRLRYLKDSSGGCNFDFDPFRRLPLTWYWNLPGEEGDGLNFVNSHVVNIAQETSPTHFHPPQPIGGGAAQNEMYLVLDPATYGINTYGRTARLLTFPDLRNLKQVESHSLAPGDLVYIPAGTGHRGMDAFVNVITLPGFKPYNEFYIDQDIFEAAGDTVPSNRSLFHIRNYATIDAVLRGTPPDRARGVIWARPVVTGRLWAVATGATEMITVRKSDERGHFDHGWLNTYHTFSFADYYDPDQMGFRALRVINDDIVAPGRGFGMHGHSDMEIITYVVAGALEHKDSMGSGSVIRPGDVQRMSAGTGVRHSEFNASKTEPVHLYQIWILPKITGIAPSYEDRRFDRASMRNTLLPLVTPDGRNGSLTMNQDASLFASLLSPQTEVRHALAPGRHAWVQAVSGAVTVGPHVLRERAMEPQSRRSRS